MPAVRAMTCGASLSVTWADSRVSTQSEEQISTKITELGREGARAWLQNWFQTESGDATGVTCEDTGSCFCLSVEL